MKLLNNLLQIGFVWSILLYVGHVVSTIVTDDDATEDKLPSGVPIIRQINKVNDDGTYTYGYEAADGSFKIETRDVLGNVKGMFGFIDESGELKRVSYTANNSTGYKSRESTSPASNRVSPVVSSSYTTVRTTPKEDSATPSRKLPVLLLKNNPATHSTTAKTAVIQHIPKKILQEVEDLTSTSTTTTSSDGIGFAEYSSEGKNNNKESAAQRDNGEKLDGSAEESSFTVHKSTTTVNPLRKIFVSKRPIEEKETSSKGKGGNSLRRQSSRGYEFRPGDTSHVYGGDGYSKYSSTNIPAHLSALMSELRPIQAPRPAYIVPPPPGYGPATEGYNADSEIPVSPQDVTDYPLTTTELPPEPRLKYALRARPLKQAPAFDESVQQYVVGDDPAYHRPVQFQQVSPISVIPHGPAGPSPVPYDAYSPIPNMLREELLAIIYNYLQTRLGNLQNPYYNPIGRYPPSPYYPNNAFLPVNQLPYGGNYPIAAPYYYPPINQPPLLPYGAVPNPVPYANPNIQASSRHPNTVRGTVQSKAQTTRSSPVAEDDVDLLQMLLASPTKIPIHQLKYGDKSNRVAYKTTQPIRNVQIISAESNHHRSSSSTTEASE